MASGAAKRYAQAVFELAKEKGTLDDWQRDLERLSLMMSEPMAARYFASPSVPEDDKRQAMAQVLSGGQQEAQNLAALLLENNRLAELPRIFALFAEARLAERGIAIADVTVADTLTPDAEAAVKAHLSRIIGKQVELRLHTDPAIIGGIVARVGDQLIDGSVVNQLRRLRARLAATK